MHERNLIRAQLRPSADLDAQARELLASDLADRLLAVDGVEDVTTGVERHGDLTAEWTQTSVGLAPVQVVNDLGLRVLHSTVTCLEDLREGRDVA